MQNTNSRIKYLLEHSIHYFTVVADNLEPLIGRALIKQLKLAEELLPSHTGNQVNTNSPHSEFQEHIALKFHNLITRIGRSKYQVAKYYFDKTSQPKHQKERRILILFPQY